MTYRVKGNPQALELIRCMGDLWEGDVYDNPFRIGFKSTYTAHVCVGDKFDAEIGKKVARTHAESQAYTYVNNMLAQMITKYHNMLVGLQDSFYVKAASVIDHNEKYLEQF